MRSAQPLSVQPHLSQMFNLWQGRKQDEAERLVTCHALHKLFNRWGQTYNCCIAEHVLKDVAEVC